MGKTAIEWTEYVWNPVTGCTKVSQGCKNCYAKHQAWPRLKASKGTLYFGREFEDVRYHRERLEQPLRWGRPRRIFVNSLSDLFHEDVARDFRRDAAMSTAHVPGAHEAPGAHAGIHGGARPA
jgi:protein gp37